MEYIYFWRPIQNDVSTCLSQWYMSVFNCDGVEYCCAEQYMMAQKAKLFKDDAAYDKIMATRKPVVMKQLGQEVRHFNMNTWVAERENIVTD